MIQSVCMQVVFLGLEIVIPLVTGELLQFPKLVRSFFSLVSYMMEIYPEHVACLPGSALLILRVFGTVHLVALPFCEILKTLLRSLS